MAREPIEVKARMRARGLSPAFCADLLAADQDGGRAVDDADELPAWCTCSMRLDLGVALLHHRVEPGIFSPSSTNAGFSAAQRLHGRVGPHVLVVIEQRQPDLVLHRHDRLLNRPVLPGVGGALLALHRITRRRRRG